MVERSDPHAELGVAPDATQQEIHEAFRRRLRQHHPDTRSSAGTEDDRESDEALHRAVAAYAALRRKPPLEQGRPQPGSAAGSRPGGPIAGRPTLRTSPVLWEPPRKTLPANDLGPPAELPVSGPLRSPLLLRWLLGELRRR